MERYEINKYLTGFKEKLDSLKESIKYDELEKEIAILSEKTNKEGFWDDAKESQNTFNKLNSLKDKVKGYNDLKSRFDDLLVLDEMAAIDESLNIHHLKVHLFHILLSLY